MWAWCRWGCSNSDPGTSQDNINCGKQENKRCVSRHLLRGQIKWQLITACKSKSPNFPCKFWMSSLKASNYKLYLKGTRLLKNKIYFFPLLNFSWKLSPKFNMGLRKKILRQKIHCSCLWNFMGQTWQIPAPSPKKPSSIPPGLRDVLTCSRGNLQFKCFKLNFPVSK